MHVSAAIVTAFDAADRHLDRAITFLRHMAQLTIDSVLVPLKHAVWRSLTSTTEVIGKWTIDMSTKGNHFQVVEQVRRDHQDKRDDATGQGEMSSPSVEDKHWQAEKNHKVCAPPMGRLGMRNHIAQKDFVLTMLKKGFMERPQTNS
ncbi:hypothetical protein CB0940_07953 [Cercospora beticola]|nr:hypothetical protein CB0940_07953 [Cercospora beticola]PIA89392.1 hypothetical protein CB0940_07953 [Cercospora beticola]